MNLGDRLVFSMKLHLEQCPVLTQPQLVRRCQVASRNLNLWSGHQHLDYLDFYFLDAIASPRLCARYLWWTCGTFPACVAFGSLLNFKYWDLGCDSISRSLICLKSSWWFIYSPIGDIVLLNHYFGCNSISQTGCGVSFNLKYILCP